MRDLRGGQRPEPQRIGREADERPRLRRASPSCSTGSASRRSRTGATTTGKGSRSRPSGGSAATASATCRRSRRRRAAVRHRDLLLEATGVDADALVNDADPVLRRVPRSGAGALATAAARRGVLTAPSARSTASRAGRPTAGCAGWRRSWAGSRTSRSRRWSRSCESLEILGVAEEEWDELPLGHAAGPARLGGHGPAGRAPRRPRGAPGAGGEPGRVPGRSGWSSTGSPWPTRPARRSDYDGPLSELRDRSAARIDTHWPPSVEQRAFLVFQLAQVLGLVARRPLPAEQAGMGDAARARSRPSPGSSGGGSSTWPTSSGSRPRRSTPSRLHAPAAGRPAAVARGSRWSAASTSAKSRSAATWRSWPRRRDLRRGRVLQRRHVLPGGGRRALRRRSARS